MYPFEFEDETYSLSIECDNIEFDEIKLWLIEKQKSHNPVLSIILTPLWLFNDIEKDEVMLYKKQILGSERILFKTIANLYKNGDYYQSSIYIDYEISKEHISNTAITHNILISNKTQINFIKRIFSSSKKVYRWESFFSPCAINFWEKQLEKGNPFDFFNEDERYLLNLND